MINLWIIAGAAALAAAALVARRGRRRYLKTTSPESIEPLSTEWLSDARGRRDENW